MNINNINDAKYISPPLPAESVIETRPVKVDMQDQDITVNSGESDEAGHDLKDIKNIAGRINDQLISKNIAMRFYIHEATDEVVVKIIDNNSHEVIKEIPPKEMLDLKGRIDEMVGMLLDRKI